jgi:hypothetical protein
MYSCLQIPARCTNSPHNRARLRLEHFSRNRGKQVLEWRFPKPGVEILLAGTLAGQRRPDPGLELRRDSSSLQAKKYEVNPVSMRYPL